MGWLEELRRRALSAGEALRGTFGSEELLSARTLLDELRDPVDRRPDQGEIRSDQGYLSSVCMRNRIDRTPSKVQCTHHICLHNKWNRLS